MRIADYREQLISREEYDRTITAYGTMVGFPTDATAFVDDFKRKLATIVQRTDATFLSNQAVTLVNGEPVITRPKTQPEPVGLRALEMRWENLLTHT